MMSQRSYLENIIIPSNGQEIALKMKEAKQNNDTDFYQALWWHDIFHYEDQNSLNTFISNFSPDVEKDTQTYINILNLNDNDLEKLAKMIRNRSIEDYEVCFGIN